MLLVQSEDFWSIIVSGSQNWWYPDNWCIQFEDGAWWAATCCSSIIDVLLFCVFRSSNPALSCVLSDGLCANLYLPDYTIIMTRIPYMRKDLLECLAHTGPPPTDIPAALRRHRRGKRTSVKTRGRRQSNWIRYKPCLPSVVCHRKHKIAKMDEIPALVNRKALGCVSQGHVWMGRY